MPATHADEWELDTRPLLSFWLDQAGSRKPESDAPSTVYWTWQGNTSSGSSLIQPCLSPVKLVAVAADAPQSQVRRPSSRPNRLNKQSISGAQALYPSG